MADRYEEAAGLVRTYEGVHGKFDGADDIVNILEICHDVDTTAAYNELADKIASYVEDVYKPAPVTFEEAKP